MGCRRESWFEGPVKVCAVALGDLLRFLLSVFNVSDTIDVIVANLQTDPNLSIVCYVFALFGGLVLFGIPLTARGRAAARWIRLALFMVGPMAFAWGTVGFMLILLSSRAPDQTLNFLYNLKATLAWMSLAILILLFCSGEFLAAFGKTGLLPATSVRNQLTATERPRVDLPERSIAAICTILPLLLAIFAGYVSALRTPRTIWSEVAEAMRASDFTKAQKLAEAFVHQHPSDYHAHEALGNIELAMGDTASAEAEYQRAYELLPRREIAEHLEAIRKRRQRDASTTASPSPPP